MNATIISATDDILGMFKTAWETSGTASELSVGVYVPVYWPNADKLEPTDSKLEWVRATFIESADGQHAGIGSGTGRYRKTGFLVFQIFTRKGEGVSRFNALSQQIVNAFDGKTSINGVTFTQTKVNQAGVSGGWHQTNVSVFFEFDEFK